MIIFIAIFRHIYLKQLLFTDSSKENTEKTQTEAREEGVNIFFIGSTTRNLT